MDRIRNFVLPVFWCLVALVFFLGLGKNALGNWDEAWYADISRTMASSRDFLSPTWNKGLFFDKPPMYYWSSAPLYILLGDSEWSARLPSAVSGFLTVILVWMIVKMVTGSRISAAIAVVALIGMPGYLSRARSGNMDTMFTMWIVAGTFCWVKAIRSVGYRWWGVLGIALAGGWLTKGFGTFAFVAVSFVLSLCTGRFRKDVRGYVVSVGIALSVAAVWLVSMDMRFGEVFLGTFFGHQSGKLTSTWMIWKNFTFDFARYLVSGLKIWVIPFVVALPLVLIRMRKKPALVLAVFIPVFFFLISCSVNKSNWFLVPIYPYVAMVIAFTAPEFVIRRNGKHLMDVGLLGLAVSITLFQFGKYGKEFFPPDVNRAQAELAKEARRLTTDADTLYMTGYYYPSTAYYSGRRTLSVFSEVPDPVSWWILPKSDWAMIVQGDRVYVMTTDEDRGNYGNLFSAGSFAEIARQGDMVLLKKL